MSELQYVKEEYFTQAEFLYSLCIDNNENREILTNLLVIDIVTQLEVYVERLLKQFVKQYNLIGLTSCQIDERIKLEHSKKIISKLNDSFKHEHKTTECMARLEDIRDIWTTEKQVKIDLNLKYPRGKHGELQFEKLFKKIGIDDIFNEIVIQSDSSSLLEESTLDVSNFIQEITTKRNLAIHEGVPLHTQLSLEAVRKYIDIIDNILSEITITINHQLNRSSQCVSAIV